MILEGQIGLAGCGEGPHGAATAAAATAATAAAASASAAAAAAAATAAAPPYELPAQAALDIADASFYFGQPLQPATAQLQVVFDMMDEDRMSRGVSLGQCINALTTQQQECEARFPAWALFLEYELYRLGMEMDAATYLRDNTWGDELGYDH